MCNKCMISPSLNIYYNTDTYKVRFKSLRILTKCSKNVEYIYIFFCKYLIKGKQFQLSIFLHYGVIFNIITPVFRATWFYKTHPKTTIFMFKKHLLILMKKNNNKKYFIDRATWWLSG